MKSETMERPGFNPGPVSGHENVRRLLTPRTLSGTRKGSDALLNRRRDMTVNSKESGMNAGHCSAQAGQVRGELKGEIAANARVGTTLLGAALRE